MAKTTIRVARRDDYEGLCAVIKELDDFHADALPRFFHRFDGPARSLEWFTEALESPDTLLLVAQHEGVIAGFLSALVRQNPDMPMFVPRRWLQVDNVAVLRAYRGMGRARADGRGARLGAGAGAGRRWLTVWEFNQDAIAFYEALGYTTTVRRLWKDRVGAALARFGLPSSFRPGWRFSSPTRREGRKHRRTSLVLTMESGMGTWPAEGQTKLVVEQAQDFCHHRFERRAGVDP